MGQARRRAHPYAAGASARERIKYAVRTGERSFAQQAVRIASPSGLFSGEHIRAASAPKIISQNSFSDKGIELSPARHSEGAIRLRAYGAYHSDGLGGWPQARAVEECGAKASKAQQKHSLSLSIQCNQVREASVGVEVVTWCESHQGWLTSMKRGSVGGQATLGISRRYISSRAPGADINTDGWGGPSIFAREAAQRAEYLSREAA